MMKPNYEKILQARKSRRSRKDPFIAFINKISTLDNLFKMVHKKTKNKNIIQECRGQIVIGLVSALEVYFKDIALLLLENCHVHEKDVMDKDMKVDLIELREMINRKITLPELVLWQYDFSYLPDLQKFFSNGFKIDFMSELKKSAFEIDEKKGFIPIKIHKETKYDEFSDKYFYLDKDFYRNIQDVLNVRNTLVHDFDPKFKLTKGEVEKFGSNIFGFVFFIDTFISNLCAQRKRKVVGN